MAFRWSFVPDPVIEEPNVEKPFKEPAPKKPSRNRWRAPEHGRLTADMKRDYPRDDFGRKIEGTERQLVVDTRPEILIPKPKPIYLV